MKTVNPQNLPLVDYRRLQPLQENLKDLHEANYNKLKKSLETHGFFVPAFVWFDGDTPYIIDSHQRHRLLMLEEIVFENTGYEIPYIKIEAKDEQDAIRKLLVITSQYGTVTQDGLDELAASVDLDLEDLEINFDALRFSGMDDLEPVEDAEDEKKSPLDNVPRWTLDELIGLRGRFEDENNTNDATLFLTWLARI